MRMRGIFQSWMELVERFIERVLQEISDKGESILREMRRELSEAA